jgi:hypothetical protein
MSMRIRMCLSVYASLREHIHPLYYQTSQNAGIGLSLRLPTTNIRSYQLLFVDWY